MKPNPTPPPTAVRPPPPPPPAGPVAPLAPQGPRAPIATRPLLGPGDFELVRKLVHERSGIVLEPRQEYLVETRLRVVAQRRGWRDLARLFDVLRGGADLKLATEAVEALTTNETSFFRDVEPFAALKGHVLPELLLARAARRSLRIWSAAASSGQEAYSLLMLLRTTFPQLAQWRVEVVGTDLSSEMVRRAKAATYSSFEIHRGMPEALVARWLEPCGEDFRVKEELRKAADFREMNLLAPWPPLGTFDLVLLRNVLIYFDVETKRQLLRRLRGVVADDGFLVVGASESLLGIDESWRPLRVGKATVYRP